MQRKLSTSHISGLALFLFAAFVIGTCELNNEALNRFFMNFELIILLIGIPYIAVTSLAVSQKLVSPKKDPRVIPHSTLLVVAVLSCPILIVGFLFCPLLIIGGAPLLVWSAQAVASTVLIRSGVPKDCMLLLIASVILAAAVSPVAIAIGSEKDPDVGRLLLSPQILSWLVCAIAATFRIQNGRTTTCESDLANEDTSANERKFATSLWTVAVMVWMIVLLWIEGISEKGSL